MDGELRVSHGLLDISRINVIIIGHDNMHFIEEIAGIVIAGL